uniref:AAA_12 domain-containing protein n=1 Tax=Haemonchus contortus TaxID=6289 RepID=A0A7I4YLT4_HAECO
MRFPSPNIPFMFIDAIGTDVRASSKSLYNEDEAIICRHLIDRLIGVGVPPQSICFIAFYREQYRHVKEEMGDLGFELTTVDSVQGREKDVVILLATKTKISQDPEGEFINAYRRLNVAVTQSRHGQFIIGQASTLRQVPV